MATSRSKKSRTPALLVRAKVNWRGACACVDWMRFKDVYVRAFIYAHQSPFADT